MKLLFRLLVLLFCLGSTVSMTAQIMSVDKIVTTSKVFKGKIGEGTDITMYLEYYELSGFHYDVYSVKGWYYYDKYKKKIPIVGIYNGTQGEELTIFVMTDAIKADSILTGLSYWADADRLGNSTGYDEKFVLTADGEKGSGKWSNVTKSLPVVLYDHSLAVYSETAYLRIKNGTEAHDLCLDDIVPYVYGYELVAQAKTKQGYRVLLEFEYPSNRNYQGRCGAGTTAGYIQLNLSVKFSLVDITEAETEDCNSNTYIEKTETISPNVTKFEVSGGVTDKVTHFVTIDTKNATLVVE